MTPPYPGLCGFTVDQMRGHLVEQHFALPYDLRDSSPEDLRQIHNEVHRSTGSGHLHPEDRGAEYGGDRMTDCKGPEAAERVKQRFSQEDIRQMARLAQAVRDSPDEVSSFDKLRNIANWIDINDAEHGRTGTEAQDFLRALADKLEYPTSGRMSDHDH